MTACFPSALKEAKHTAANESLRPRQVNQGTSRRPHNRGKQVVYCTV